jgi:hypothetical protein
MAIRTAGPPVAWVAIAAAVGLIAVIVLWVIGVHDPATLVAVPFIAFVVVCIVDRDGWRIRMATAELAALQRQRWNWGRLPADPMTADAWLAAHPDAPLLDRAGTLVTAGRAREARALIETAVGATPEDAIRLERMRLTIDAALAGAALDQRAIDAFERLPELAAVSDAERRYHRLSLAWSVAWFEIQAHRPWRAAFADAVRGLGPFRPPPRYLVFHGVQQLALPIAYALALLIVTWLGIADWLR